MSDHLKRLNAPDSWHIAKKTNKFITKTSAGPHNANALPVAVWLRDRMGFARTMKEVKQILSQKDLIVNGRPCRNPKMGIGIFDIVALPKIGKYYRSRTASLSSHTRQILRGCAVLLPAGEESSGARPSLCQRQGSSGQRALRARPYTAWKDTCRGVQQSPGRGRPAVRAP